MFRAVQFAFADLTGLTIGLNPHVAHVSDLAARSEGETPHLRQPRAEAVHGAVHSGI